MSIGYFRQCSRCCKLEYKKKEATSSENLKHAMLDRLRHGSTDFNFGLTAY